MHGNVTVNADVLLKPWLEQGMIGRRNLYLVGGCVRDLLMNRSPKDLDLVCRNAKELACRIAAVRNAALVPMEKKPGEPCYRLVDRSDPEALLDIAEMRGGTIREDLLQRDFTINAVAVDISHDPGQGVLVDPLNGLADIEQRVIRVVSEQAFSADPLRLLRAVRFSAELGFSFEAATRRLMQGNPELLSPVAAERTMSELLRILRHAESSVFFRHMDELGMLDVLFPEIRPMKACPQNGYHHLDVWNHSLLVMEQVEQILKHNETYFGGHGPDVIMSIGHARIPVFKLAALLHDIGKPGVTGINPATGRLTFYRHEREGARLMDTLAVRMKMSGRQREFLVRMVACHLRPLMLFSPKTTAAARTRWFRNMQDDAVSSLVLSMADVMSSQGPESGEEYRSGFMQWAVDRMGDYFTSIKKRIEGPLLVNGNDLIALGMEPGPAVGRILRRVRTAQDNAEVSTRAETLALAEKIMAAMKMRGEGHS